MDRRQEKIADKRHSLIFGLLLEIHGMVDGLSTVEMGGVNVAAHLLELQQERDTLKALLSDVIKERNELLDDLEAQVLHDTSDLDQALEEATRARLRNLLAWRVTSLKLDCVTDQHRQLIAQHLLVNRDFEALKAAYEDLAAREAQVSSDLVECQLDLKNTEAALATERALSEKLEDDLDKALARTTVSDQLLQGAVDNSKAAKAPLAQLLGCEPTLEAITAAIKALKAAPAPIPAKAAPFVAAAGIQVTPLAETVRELASRGHKAEGVHRIINQRSEPSAVINLAGIRAIYDMVVPQSGGKA